MRPNQKQRGLSLMEALVAMAVMAFGMLGIVGIQTTLRQNGDVSKQRTEAVRIAQQNIEHWRAFNRLDIITDPASKEISYANLESGTESSTSTNTTFNMTRTVTESISPPFKTINVDVSWLDRKDETQTIRLSTLINGTLPQLAATISVPADGDPFRRVHRRHASIPQQAVSISNGTSAFMPPQNPGGTVVWTFNNATGAVQVCQTTAPDTAALNSANITGCDTVNFGFLLSGTVRHLYGTNNPSASLAEDPTSDLALPVDISVTLTSSGLDAAPAPTCFDDSPSSRTGGVTAVNYYCIVFPNARESTLQTWWSGYSDVISSDTSIWSIGQTAATYKVCRYTILDSDTLTPTSSDVPADYLVKNAHHPMEYRKVAAPLANQNFLIIKGDAACPSDTAVDLSTGNYVNSNTRLHQPRN